MNVHENNTFEQRVTFSNYIQNKYPNRVPVIIKNGSKILQDIDKSGQARYLMSKNLNIIDLIVLIRKKIHINEKQGIFIFANGFLIPMNKTILEVYNTYKSEDNILYVTYNIENTFG